MYKIDRRGGSKNRILGQTRNHFLKLIVMVCYKKLLTSNNLTSFIISFSMVVHHLVKTNVLWDCA